MDQQCAPHNVGQGVQGSHLMKMNLLQRGSVYFRFRFTQNRIDCRGGLFYGIRQRERGNPAADRWIIGVNMRAVFAVHVISMCVSAVRMPVAVCMCAVRPFMCMYGSVV